MKRIWKGFLDFWIKNSKSFLVGLFIFSQLISINDADAQIKKYKFHYRIQPDFNQEVNQIHFDTLGIVGNLLKLTLTDLNNYPLAFSNIEIISQDSVYKFLTDQNGEISPNLSAGIYSVKIHYPTFKKFEYQLKINPDLAINFKIKLGRAKSLNVYTIQSKKRLSKEKLDELETCIEKSKIFNSCSDEGKYYIFMEI